jgi:hypothetical protein
MARDATVPPWHTSRTLRFTRSHPRSLLSRARLNRAKSRVLLANCRRIRIDQISFGFSGGFCPSRRPLFQECWQPAETVFLSQCHACRLFQELAGLPPEAARELVGLVGASALLPAGLVHASRRALPLAGEHEPLGLQRKVQGTREPLWRAPARGAGRRNARGAGPASARIT